MSNQIYAQVTAIFIILLLAFGSIFYLISRVQLYKNRYSDDPEDV